MAVAILLPPGLPKLECRAFTGEERLGEPSRFEVSAISPQAIAAEDIVHQACTLYLQTRYGERQIFGVVRRFAMAASSSPNAARNVRLSVCSRIGTFDLRRRSRVYQHLSVPDIIKKLLIEGGHAEGDIKLALAETYTPRKYVVQYAESDAAFIRRLCEEEGIYFHFPCALSDKNESIELVDRSCNAVKALPDTLFLADESGLVGPSPAITAWRSRRKRVPGKVTLRDYDHEHPAVKLEACKTSGNDFEQGIEIYEAPGRFTDSASGDQRARVRLESLRAEATKNSFHSNALALAPGLSFGVKPTGDYDGPPPSTEAHLVTRVVHDWSFGNQRHVLDVEATPLDVPYRLERKTPRPRINGVQSATVTGEAGAEVHPDELGRIFVRFHWDSEGPNSDKSSLPIRTMQPNTPGSMIIPRVGWEVFVVFEDGDPDRPYVIGRSYNAKEPPPAALPANKTMTILASNSSPGGGGQNRISFDDGAGRQHMTIQAASGKSTNVAAKMSATTGNNERHTVTGSQTRSVGGSDAISVKQAYSENVGSQSGSVGGLHKVATTGNLTIGVGSETVVIGAAHVEQIGNPVKGALNLAASKALNALGGKGIAGAVASAALGVAKSAGEAYMKGGANAAANAAKDAAAGTVVGMLPGGSAIMAGVKGAKVLPWDKDPPPAGAQEGGGGAGGGASDAAGAGGPGPGHRNVVVGGTAFIGVAGSSTIASPGSVTWTTLGVGALATAGSRITNAASAGFSTTGGALESVGGTLSITASGTIGHSSAVLATMTTSGATSVSGTTYTISGAKLTMKIGGALTMKGSHVTFSVPGATVSAGPGGVTLKAATIEISGKRTQSGDYVHG